MQYKETLNLPVTDFPMKANLVKKEPEILKQWETEDLYGQIRKEKKGNPKYVFMMAKLAARIDQTVDHQQAKLFLPRHPLPLRTNRQPRLPKRPGPRGSNASRILTHWFGRAFQPPGAVDQAAGKLGRGASVAPDRL